MASRGILPILKETLVKLILGYHALRTLVFVTEITDEVILGLDV
jgi:hypothetical protein